MTKLDNYDLFIDLFIKGGYSMIIFKENKVTGLSCGVNDWGELFIGDNRSGANLSDTPENREYILEQFKYWDNKN